MSITITGILPDPFGNPASNVEFRVITETNITSVLTSIAKHTTNTLGEYSFELLNNTYSLFVKVDDTFELIGSCVVEDSTPTPISIPDLIRYTSPVLIPEIGNDIVLWDNLYSAIQGDLETIYQEGVTQIRDGDVYSSKTKHLWTDNGSMADQVDIISTGSSTITKRPVAYSDDSGNQSVQDNATLSVNLGTASTELYIRSDGTGGSKTEVTTDTGYINKESTLSSTTVIDNEVVTFNGNGTSKDLEVTDTSSILAESLDHSLGEYTVALTDSGSIEHGYRDDNQVTLATVPKVEQISSMELIGGIHNISIIDKLLARINEMDEAITELRKEITIGTKTTSITQSNDGFDSSVEVVTDDYIIRDERGNTTFEVDTINSQVTISGRLTIENAEDFMGTDGSTIFQVFRYSTDGVNYHDDWVVGDTWRMHNTSTDGYVNPTEWSDGYLLMATDGADGDTVYMQYMYSTNNVEWHEIFVDGDIWRRERTIENNIAITEWSEAAQIKGSDGANGEIVTIIYEYSIDGFEPWHTNFATGDHYRREAVSYYTTVQDKLDGNPYYTTSWSVDPVKMVPIEGTDYISGTAGLHGSGSYIVYVATEALATGYTDTERDGHILTLSGRDAQAGDILSYYGNDTVADDDQFSYQYLRGDTVWTEFVLQINGSAIINGTLAAESLKADTITGVSLDVTGKIRAKSITLVESPHAANLITPSTSYFTVADESTANGQASGQIDNMGTFSWLLNRYTATTYYYLTTGVTTTDDYLDLSSGTDYLLSVKVYAYTVDMLINIGIRSLTNNYALAGNRLIPANTEVEIVALIDTSTLGTSTGQMYIDLNSIGSVLVTECMLEPYTGTIETSPYNEGTVTNISAVQIKSNTYVEGSNGWAIDSQGDCEFNDATVRGHIEAESGSFKGIISSSIILGSYIYGANFLIPCDPNNDGETTQLYYPDDPDLPVAGKENVYLEYPTMLEAVGMTPIVGGVELPNRRAQHNYSNFACAWDNKLPYTFDRSSYTIIPADTFYTQGIVTNMEWNLQPTINLSLAISTLDRATDTEILAASTGSISVSSGSSNTMTITHAGLQFEVTLTFNPNPEIYSSGWITYAKDPYLLTVRNLTSAFGSISTTTHGYIRLEFYTTGLTLADVYNVNITSSRVLLDNTAPAIQ